MTFYSVALYPLIAIHISDLNANPNWSGFVYANCKLEFSSVIIKGKMIFLYQGYSNTNLKGPQTFVL